jgi:hypothetical protein
MITTFAAKAQQELDMLTDDVTKWLATGKAKDYAEYRYMVGQLTALGAAHQILDGLLRAYELSEDQ